MSHSIENTAKFDMNSEGI